MVLNLANNLSSREIMLIGWFLGIWTTVGVYAVIFVLNMLLTPFLFKVGKTDVDA
jgi:hypothetical protein